MSSKDLSGKVMIVTGANTGIGRETALSLASRGARVVLACRSKDKTAPVIDEIVGAGGAASFVALDLADLDSVRACGAELLASEPSIDVLVNNAGQAGLRGLTKQGFELTFGINHLGHFLLTMLLLPRLRERPGSRIVNVSSKAHYQAKRIDWDALKKPTVAITGLPEYEVSKLCNVLFTRSLARGKAGPNVHSYALHPGVVASDAWRQVPWPVRPLIKMFMIDNAEGARTSVHCAASPEAAAEDGLYYDACKPKKASRLALDDALADELWKRSAEWTGADA